MKPKHHFLKILHKRRFMKTLFFIEIFFERQRIVSIPGSLTGMSLGNCSIFVFQNGTYINIITDYHSLGGLNTKIGFLQPKVKMPTGLVSGDASPLGLLPFTL